MVTKQAITTLLHNEVQQEVYYLMINPDQADLKHYQLNEESLL